MGAVLRILFFIIGLLGIALTGMYGAQNAGVDTASWLSKLGGASGAATALLSMFAGGLDALGGMLAGDAAGAEKPSLLATWGPTVGAGLISMLFTMGAMRR